jgi:2-oxoisovalerate dehydrogenase E1 component
MGHEALAAVSIQMEPDDYIVSYYRDRGLVLGRGMTTRQLGLEYFAKRNTGSGGRQMPSHYSDADLHIWSVPTPTGSQLLPACGIAWGIKLDGKKNVVVTTIGDAATRQGDFFEAICFAKEKKLPVLFLVEDNAYGISMPTRKTNPLALDILEQDNWRQIEGQDVQQVYDATAEAFEKIRAGGGPFFFWIKMERLSSHTSSDDHKLYRAADELRDLEKSDPLTCWKDQLTKEGVITRENYEELDNEIKERVRREYAEAEKAEDPSPNELLANVTKPAPRIEKEILPPGKYRIGDTVNKTLRAADKDRNGHLWYLALSGLRRAEIAGLRWGDVDFDAGTISIERGRVQVGAAAVDDPYAPVHATRRDAARREQPPVREPRRRGVRESVGSRCATLRARRSTMCW